VDDAAGGEMGSYNIAEDYGTVSIQKAADVLGWVPGFRF
jgi:hypothetical protein